MGRYNWCFDFSLRCSIPFGIPADELNNLSIPTEELLGEQAEAIYEQIASAPSTDARISLLTEYLKIVLSDKPIHDRRIIHAIQYIRKHDGNVNIKNLSKNCYLSEKQLERCFKTYAGFTPKLYARIVRFETALNEPQGGASDFLVRVYTSYKYFPENNTCILGDHQVKDALQYLTNGRKLDLVLSFQNENDPELIGWKR